MKEKDFKSLSVKEQEEKIMKLVTSWCKQDSNNRSAIVLLGSRENKEDTGETSCRMLGPTSLIMASLDAALSSSENLNKMVSYCLTNFL